MAAIFTTDTMHTAGALHAMYEKQAEAALPGSDNDWRRDHLGASIAGHDCDRYLWLSFRWALNPKHKGKQLRLFARGDREETWIIEDLRKLGLNVIDRDDATGEQLRADLGPHLGGGLDGTVLGLIEAPETEHVLEIKTHNRKQFEKLKKDGVKRSKPQHYTQMQLYMLARKLTRAFYIAVCKDNDELYTERVRFDKAFADAAHRRMRAIVDMESPPERLDKENPPCVYTTKEGERYPCQFFDLCHASVLPEKNCRTCIEVTPHTSKMTGLGEWYCDKHNISLKPEEQRRGCSEHLTIPPIINGQVMDADHDKRTIKYQLADRVHVDGPKQRWEEPR